MGRTTTGGLARWLHVALFVVGAGVVVGAFFQAGAQRFVTALVLGLGCCVVATLETRLRELAIDLWGARLGMKAQAEVEASAIAAELPSDERDRAATALDEAARQRAEARHLVASAAVDQLFRPRDGPLAGCDFRLFLYDGDLGRLLPAFEPAERSTGWETGQGVTGEAWRRAEYVAATGAECRDETYHLTRAQQDRYRALSAVAAAPVFNAAGDVIAVLSGSTTDESSQLTTPEGFDAHLALAACAARVLVDLLGWSTDG